MKEVDLYAGLEGLDSMTGSFIRDLVIGYIISGIATVAIGVSMLKKKTDKTNITQPPLNRAGGGLICGKSLKCRPNRRHRFYYLLYLLFGSFA